MKHLAFVTIGFLAGLGLGFFARSADVGTPHSALALAADLAAIQKLHQIDIDATLSQDPKELMDIWSEDAVRFNPPALPAVGKPAIETENQKFRVQYPAFKVLSYVPKYKDIQVDGDVACVRFERKSEFKLSPESQAATWQATGLEVLKRQKDGSWKFAAFVVNQ